MFVFLISLTSVYLFQSKGALKLNVTGNNALIIEWKSFDWNSVMRSFLDQTNTHCETNSFPQN